MARVISRRCSTASNCRPSRERFEVIVADDGSTDGGTDDVATEDGHVRVVDGPPVNAYAARNRAVATSSAAVLAFCDADCLPEPRWLERGVAALEDADVVAGRIRMRIPRKPSVWSLLDAETTKDHERQVAVGNAETANLFLRRDLYDKVGPFDAAQPGYGDFEFVLRCVSRGATLAYAGDAVVTHPVRVSGRGFLRNVWLMNHSYAAFEARAGRVPGGVRLREWVPIIQTVRARRRFGMSIRLDRRWMGANGFQPRLRDDLRALPLTYLSYRTSARWRNWPAGLRSADAAQIVPRIPAQSATPSGGEKGGSRLAVTAACRGYSAQLCGACDSTSVLARVCLWIQTQPRTSSPV